MDPITLLLAIAGFTLLALCLDFHSKSEWAKANKLGTTLLHIAAIGAGFAVLYHMGRFFDAFYVSLFGLAIGYRIAGALTARATRRAQVKELNDKVEAALLEKVGAVNVDIKIDVSTCPRYLLDERIAVLVKDGYTVSTVQQYNDNKVTLQITGCRTTAT
ncbi:hypothetical protein KBI23_24420 [bacterium]|jgi:hypothetical protein|nr:hypothetical protein [bacterium]